MASYGLCPARTAPPGPSKYAGISLFLLDMDAPGLRVAPIPLYNSYSDVFAAVDALSIALRR